MLFIVLIFFSHITGCPCTVGFPVLSHYNSFRHTVLFLLLVHLSTSELARTISFSLRSCCLLYEAVPFFFRRMPFTFVDFFMYPPAPPACLKKQYFFFTQRLRPAQKPKTKCIKTLPSTIKNTTFFLFHMNPPFIFDILRRVFSCPFNVTIIILYYKTDFVYIS